jgi:hypothetical protein
MLKGSNVQYARFLSADSGRALRQVFHTLYGSTAHSITPEQANSIGLDHVTDSNKPPGANEVFFRVKSGPFAHVYHKSVGDKVHPMQLMVHPEYINLGYNAVFSGRDGGYASNFTHNQALVDDGAAHMATAIQHLTNAAATYIYETAYDDETLKVPGNSRIPAGAFAMLPRADVNAVLAAAVLYPRSATNDRTPAFAERVGRYGKDANGPVGSTMRGSIGSMICAAGYEVLQNYASETLLGSGELSLLAKMKPENLGVVMGEAARRVAEITRLAEIMG